MKREKVQQSTEALLATWHSQVQVGTGTSHHLSRPLSSTTGPITTIIAIKSYGIIRISGYSIEIILDPSAGPFLKWRKFRCVLC